MVSSALVWGLFAAQVAVLVTVALLLNRKLRRLRAMQRRLERHTWETQNIFCVLHGGSPLPVPGGWAASTDLLGEVLRAVAALRPQKVVELGSGLSTVVIAAALRANGGGEVISIDADEAYAGLTRAQLRQHGLSDYAQVRFASLKEQLFEDGSRPWYDTAVLNDLHDIDLLLIDGPPTALRADIRHPALPFFWSRLRQGALVLLDDAARPAERDIARRWQRSFPSARHEFLRLEKGALRVTLPGGSAPG